MPGPPVAVVDYGIGNLRSAERALLAVGADARLVTRPEGLRRAAAVVLPGVGAFGRCAEALVSTGLADGVREAVEQGRPFLGICVGFQLLYQASEESPGEAGLGRFQGTVRRLPEGVKRPQMQWNRLRVLRPSRLLAGLPEEPWLYFVHSFSPPPGPEAVAVCDYGGPVTAAAEEDGILGTQFHPEKSGPVGLQVLRNFLALVEEV